MQYVDQRRMNFQLTQDLRRAASTRRRESKTQQVSLRRVDLSQNRMDPGQWRAVSKTLFENQIYSMEELLLEDCELADAHVGAFLEGLMSALSLRLTRDGLE